MDTPNYTEQEMIDLLMSQTWYVCKDMGAIEDFFRNSKTPLSVSLLDTEDWKYRFVNENYCEFYGATEAEIMKWTVDDIKKIAHPESFDILTRLYERMRKTGTMVSGIFRMKPIEGEDYSWRFKTMKICSQSKILCSLGISVNEFYKMEDKLQHQSDVWNYQRVHFKQFLSLSDREKEVLRLTLKGSSNKETADALFISLETVKQHLKNIRNKTGLTNMNDLMHFAQAFDIV